MRLIRDKDGTEVPMWSSIPDIDGNTCVIEMLVDHHEVGPMVLLSHENAGAHLVRADRLRCHIETG